MVASSGKRKATIAVMAAAIASAHPVVRAFRLPLLATIAVGVVSVVVLRNLI